MLLGPLLPLCTSKAGDQMTLRVLIEPVVQVNVPSVLRLGHAGHVGRYI